MFNKNTLLHCGYVAYCQLVPFKKILQFATIDFLLPLLFYRFTAESKLSEHPQKVMMQLTKLVLLNPTQLIPLLDDIVALLPVLLGANIPRRLQQLVVQLWMKLNTVVPRRYVSQPAKV